MDSKATLLIVEDEDVLLGGLQFRYGHRYKVVTARNVKRAEGVIAANGGDIKAAVVDLWMPLKDNEPIDECAGLKLISAMRGSESVKGIAPSVPVIILTGKSDVSSAREGMRLGAQAYVIKRADGKLDMLDRQITYAVQLGRAMDVLKLVDPNTFQLREGISEAGLDLLAEMLNDLRQQFGM